jgi:hypothetical protein
MTTHPHPDTHTDWQAFKELKRGGRQAAEDVAMEAMWLAIEAGCDNGVAAEVFSKTYQQIICASKKTNAVS